MAPLRRHGPPDAFSTRQRKARARDCNAAGNHTHTHVRPQASSSCSTSPLDAHQRHGHSGSTPTAHITASDPTNTYPCPCSCSRWCHRHGCSRRSLCPRLGVLCQLVRQPRQPVGLRRRLRRRSGCSRHARATSATAVATPTPLVASPVAAIGCSRCPPATAG